MRCALIPAMMIVPFPLTAAQRTQDTSAAEVHAELRRIQADLRTVKAQLGQVLRLLTQSPPARSEGAVAGPVRASVSDAPKLGRPDAPVTVVEFSDYACPFCGRFFATTLPVLKQDYIDTGKVRYVFRDFPLEMHPEARKAAEAAHCAGEHGKYWEMHDVLFQHQSALSPPQLTEYARRIGLERAEFEECLSSGRHAATVARSIAEGTAAGVRGTPGFVVGKTKPGDIVEGVPIRGAQPLESFRGIIDQVLAEP